MKALKRYLEKNGDEKSLKHVFKTEHGGIKPDQGSDHFDSDKVGKSSSKGEYHGNIKEHAIKLLHSLIADDDEYEKILDKKNKESADCDY